MQSKTLSEPVPFDLIVEICSWLPAKSVARFRSVSKPWASLFHLPSFTDLFWTRSSARPQLLSTFVKDGYLFIFSSPQPQKLDHESPSLLVADYHTKIPYKIFSHIGGLIFLSDEEILPGKDHHVSMICNPSTGQNLTLPNVNSRRRLGVRTYFGYDPIEKQYKALSMTCEVFGATLASEDHQVLTLGTGGELSWRKIECCIPHSPRGDLVHICINGVIYYQAMSESTEEHIIVCFDVKSEKFAYVNEPDPYPFTTSMLINYNGKLASVESSSLENYESIKLRVLEDAEKHEWLEHVYSLPALWKNVVGNTNALRFVGVTRTNELVFSTLYSEFFCVFYYDTERDTVREVRIQGMEAFMDCRLYTFIEDHVEDLKLW